MQHSALTRQRMSSSHKGKKLSDETKRKISGENHHRWITSKISYQGVHTWLWRTFGKADHCENAECLGTSATYNWCLIAGKEYERKRGNFIQMCRSCHSRYDYKHRKQQNGTDRK